MNVVKEANELSFPKEFDVRHYGRQYDLQGYSGYESDVIIPEGVTLISGHVFEDSEITSVVIPGSVTQIGNEAFKGCQNLKTVTFNEGLQEICEMAFYKCESLEECIFPQTLTKVGSQAFRESGVKYVEFTGDKGVTLDKQVFVDCENLARVILPKQLKNCYEEIFSGCTSLVSCDWLPTNWSCIPNGIFSNSGLRSYTIPDTIEIICEDAFSHCHELSEINIGKNVNAVFSNAFLDCPKLSSMELPYEGDGDALLEMSAFNHCPNLKLITVNAHGELILVAGDDVTPNSLSARWIVAPHITQLCGVPDFISVGKTIYQTTFFDTEED